MVSGWSSRSNTNNMVDGPVVAIGPEMRPADRCDELHRNPYPARGTPDATVDNVTDAKSAPDLAQSASAKRK
jgi:hypothetical protein